MKYLLIFFLLTISAYSQNGWSWWLVREDTLRGSADAAPIIPSLWELSPDSALAAGNILVGSDTTKTFVLGRQNAVLLSVGLTDSTEASLSVSDDSLSVTYAPTNAAVYDDSLRIIVVLLQDLSHDTLYVPISGTGVGTFALNDSTAFAAGTISIGNDTTKVWVITQKTGGLTYTTDLTDSTEAGLSVSNDSIYVTYAPTNAAAYDDTLQIAVSNGDTLRIGITGTGESAGPYYCFDEPAGNFYQGYTGGLWGMENADTIIAYNSITNFAPGNAAESAETSNPICGNTSYKVYATQLQGLGNRPYVNFYWPSAVTTISTEKTYEMGVVIRNDNDSTISIVYGGFGNASTTYWDKDIEPDSTKFFKWTGVTPTSGAGNNYWFLAFNGDQVLTQITIDQVYIKEEE